MAKLDKKRRIENKTDYRARMVMLKSGLPRIVIRKTNKYMNIQCVKSFEAKDKVEMGITSYELMEYGWPKELKGSLKSISASYLTGYLFGKKLAAKEKGKVILDMGLQRNIHGSRIFAALKGMIDAGVKISADEKSFPTEDRISGKNAKKGVNEIFNKVKSSIK